MSQKSFISDADMALASLIWNGIKKGSAAKNIVSSQDQISFSSPKSTSTHGNRKLSIFLYTITEETPKKTVAPIDCSNKNAESYALRYIITPLTGNDKDDHALLEEIIHLFLATQLLVSSDEENTGGLTVKMDSLSLDELSKLWIALGSPLRLSISLTVSPAVPRYSSQAQVTRDAVASQKSEPDTEHVVQLYQAVLKTFTEQSSGWKKRNMVVKQWLLQHFEKNTDMTVEEMLTTLNNLGDKLGQHGSTTQFIKPLNTLAEYYQLQLDQLKGMHKVSRGQRENLEAVNIWIKDVKTLVEALGS
jgi:uncharacterized protein DUF4255